MKRGAVVVPAKVTQPNIYAKWPAASSRSKPTCQRSVVQTLPPGVGHPAVLHDDPAVDHDHRDIRASRRMNEICRDRIGDARLKVKAIEPHQHQIGFQPGHTAPTGRSSAAAPPLVAISRHRRGGRVVGSPVTPLCSSEANFITSNMSRRLLALAPSVAGSRSRRAGACPGRARCRTRA